MVGIARAGGPHRTVRLTQQRNDDELRRSHDDARPVTLRGVAVTGAIASGKTTLASALAARLRARHCSSDAIRRELYGDREGNAAQVFRVMEERMRAAIAENAAFVLDSTGMSYRFREILERYRTQVIHVHLTVRDPKIFESRERGRADRPPLPPFVFHRSKSIVFATRPEVVIETDALAADEVLQNALHAIAPWFQPTVGGE